MNARRTSRHFLFAGLLTSAFIALSSASFGQQCGPESVTEFGKSFFPAQSVSTNNRTTEISPGMDGIVALKLEIVVTVGTSRDWALVVRDLNYRALATFVPEDFLDASGQFTRHRWTGHLPGNRVKFDLILSSDTLIRIEASSGFAFPGQNGAAKFFSIVNPNHRWEELYEENNLVSAKRAGDVVGMVVPAGVDDATGERRSWCCTGVMLSADLMLTNWHCGGSKELHMTEGRYWENSICQNTIVDLGWAKGAFSRQYSCSKVLAKDESLDFSLIRLVPVVGPTGTTGRPLAARISHKTLSNKLDVFVIHHAECAVKRVSAGCEVQDASYPAWDFGSDLANRPQSEFTHNCNTEPGASGAPVFDDEGKLVGLHHLGVKRAPAPACTPEDDVNKAVNIHDIIEHLKSHHPNVANELSLE
jgi:hypothetical protein